MKEIKAYKCEHCGQIYEDKEKCKEHEEIHRLESEILKKYRIYEKGKTMLRNGYTLGEIREELLLWNKLPKDIENVTKETDIVRNVKIYHIADFSIDDMLILTLGSEEIPYEDKEYKYKLLKPNYLKEPIESFRL